MTATTERPPLSQLLFSLTMTTVVSPCLTWGSLVARAGWRAAC